jgi:hypothetical protein
MTDDDDIGPVTEDERREAEALRQALESKADPAPGSDAAFAAAIRASSLGARPALAGPAKREAVKAAVAEGSRRARRRSIRTVFAIAAAAVLGLAIPAAIVRGVGSPAPALSYGGPTDRVFEGPFEDTQRASDRMDRIAVARTHDYFTALRGEQP